MKKIFGISLVGLFAAMPMMASAGVTDTQPAALGQGETASVAAANPKYALAPADSATDGNVATAGYVKGAYNAAIKGINAVQNEIDSATSALASANSALSGVESSLTSYATQSGVVATVDAATTSGSFTGASVSGNFSSAAITGTVTGSATGTVPAMTTWGDSTVGTAPATASLSGTSITGTAAGSMTGTASGTTTGEVSISSYVAS